MTFHYTDPDGDHVAVGPGITDAATGQQILSANCITLTVTRHRDGQTTGAYIPVDHVEELIAGIRDTARQAATQT